MNWKCSGTYKRVLSAPIPKGMWGLWNMLENTIPGYLFILFNTRIKCFEALLSRYLLCYNSLSAWKLSTMLLNNRIMNVLVFWVMEYIYSWKCSCTLTDLASYSIKYHCVQSAHEPIKECSLCLFVKVCETSGKCTRILCKGTYLIVSAFIQCLELLRRYSLHFIL